MRWQLIFALPFAVGIAIGDTIEYIHILGAGDAPIVEGDIIKREEWRRWAGVPAGKLTIKIVDKDTTVIARTNIPSMKELPDRVRFQYTGDPEREVFVEGEENPFWVALFLWIVSAGIVLFCIAPILMRPEVDLNRWTATGDG